MSVGNVEDAHHSTKWAASNHLLHPPSLTNKSCLPTSVHQCTGEQRLQWVGGTNPWKWDFSLYAWGSYITVQIRTVLLHFLSRTPPSHFFAQAAGSNNPTNNLGDKKPSRDSQRPREYLQFHAGLFVQYIFSPIHWQFAISVAYGKISWGGVKNKKHWTQFTGL